MRAVNTTEGCMERVRLVKRLIAAVVVLAVLWSSWWLYASMRLKGDTEAWFAARRAEGWEARYQTLRVGGFPNRLDVRLTEIVLADPRTEVIWEAPFFQILSLSYKRGHDILIWPDRQVLTTPAGRHEITGEGLRASIVTDANGAILRSNVEAQTLNIAGPRQSLALAGVTAALQKVETRARQYRIGLNAASMAGRISALPTVATDRRDGLTLQAEVAFDRPWTQDTIARPRPQPEQIALRLAEYREAGLEIKLAGALDIDGVGRASGGLTLKAVNWREILAQAEAAGRLGPGLAQTLEQGLTVVAGLSGNRNTLDLPLEFDAGRVSLGPVPLGKAPLFRLP